VGLDKTSIFPEAKPATKQLPSRSYHNHPLLIALAAVFQAIPAMG